MIRTGEQYRESLRDGREVYVDGVRVEDVTTNPTIMPSIENRARIYDMQHEAATQEIMTFEENGELFPVGNQIPTTQEHWHRKRKAVDTVMKDIGFVATSLKIDNAEEWQCSVSS